MSAVVELRLYEITVEGFGPRLYYGQTPGKARYDCFLSYNSAYEDVTFREFLKRSTIRRAARAHPEDDGYADLRRHYPEATIPMPGVRISAEGHTGTVVAALGPVSYVRFCDDRTGNILNVHPSSVAELPAKEQPHD
jgi:hypothetical protein